MPSVPAPSEPDDELHAEWLRQLIATQEDERAHAAREMHDQLGSHIAALLIGLDAIPATDDETRRAVERLRALAWAIDRDIHRVANGLRPPTIDTLGVVAALQTLSEEWSAATGIATDLATTNLAEGVPPHLEIAIFRIVQEALTNIARHARARRVSVVLDRRSDHIVVVIEDDGRGFDPSDPAAQSRLGLLGMRQRAKLLGGTVAIESTADRGTSVFVTLPERAAR